MRAINAGQRGSLDTESESGLRFYVLLLYSFFFAVFFELDWFLGLFLMVAALFLGMFVCDLAFLLCMGMLVVCIRVYICVVYMNTHTIIGLKKDILYTCTTKIQEKHKNGHKQNHTNQTHKRPNRPDNPATARKQPNAWLPNNNHNSQKLRSLPWPKHSIPSAKHDGEKKLHKKRVENGRRQTEKNL